MASYSKTTKFPFAHKYGNNGWYNYLVDNGWSKTDAKKATIRMAYGFYFKSKPPKKNKTNNQMSLFSERGIVSSK